VLKNKKSAQAKANSKDWATRNRRSKVNPLKSPQAVETRAKVRSIRIAKSGLNTRIHAHVSAAGRRNQAKRNAR